MKGQREEDTSEEQKMEHTLVAARRILACLSSPFPDDVEKEQRADQERYIKFLETELEALKKSRP